MQSNTNDKLKKIASNLGNKDGQDKRKDYIVQINIIEVRDLISNDSDGVADPFIHMTVGNLPSQVTQTRKNANTVVFNQNFTFKNLRMNQKEFEQFEIVIQVMHQNDFYQNVLIGKYSIGCSTLYRNSNHEFFQTWLPLIVDSKGVEPQGYLLMSCYILGPNDRAPVHDKNEIGVNEEEDDMFKGRPNDELTLEEQIQRRDMKKRLNAISKPKLYSQPFQLLVSIVKAEDLPIMVSNSCDSFISVRAGGIVQRTQKQANSQKPSYQVRMYFPIYFPVHNDRIVIRVWDERKVFSDIFIAGIPEIPQENDFFNINYLQSKGGIMPYRWINLYGIPMEERPSNWDELISTAKHQIGTAFMGRVLMSISLSPNDKPQTLVGQLNGYNEPKIEKHLIRIDCYEISGSNDFGEKLLVEINCGQMRIESSIVNRKIEDSNKKHKQISENGENQILLDNEQDKKQIYTYRWANSQISDQKIDLPTDKMQHPDIFVSIYSVNKKKQKLDGRVAFLRLKSSSQDLDDDVPQWYQLKSPIPSKTIESLFLLNIEMKTENSMKKNRQAARRNIKVKFIFRAYIYAGYDILPELEHNDVMCQFDMRQGSHIYNTKSIQPCVGHNPIWNKMIQEEVLLEDKFEFAPNLNINFTNSRGKGILGTNIMQDKYFGQIQIKAIMQKTDWQYNGDTIDQFKPKYQFYHVLMNGQTNGRILAAFYLFSFEKGQTIMKKPSADCCIDKFLNVDFIMPIIGVRNLPSAMKDPQLIVRIAQSHLDNKYWEYTIKIQDLNPNKSYSNPNFCQIVTTMSKQKLQLMRQQNSTMPKSEIEQNEEEDKEHQEEENGEEGEGEEENQGEVSNKKSKKINILEMPLKLPLNLLFQPQIEIELRDNAGGYFSDRYILAINIIECTPWISSNKRMRLAEIHSFFEMGKYNYLEELKELLDNSNKDQDLDGDGINDEEQYGKGKKVQLNTTEEALINKDIEIEMPDQDQEGKEKTIFDKNFNEEMELVDKQANEAKAVGLEKTKVFNPKQSVLKKSTSKEGGKALSIHSKKSVSFSGSLKGSKNGDEEQDDEKFISLDIKVNPIKMHNSEIETMLSFTKTEDDKLIEDQERKEKIKELGRLINSIQETDKDGEVKKKKYLREVENIKQLEVLETAFLGEEESGAQDEQFNYNREVIKTPYDDLVTSRLPYRKYQFFKVSRQKKGGILGEIIDVWLKAHLKLIIEEGQDYYDQMSSSYKTSLKSKSNASSKKSTTSSKKNICGLIKYTSDIDDIKYPFDIFDQLFMDYFNKQMILKCRVYILRCLNLVAQSSNVETHHMLAGMDALGSANSYPEILVGDGKTDNTQLIKFISDVNKIIKNELNPEFQKMYELDATLPEDWRLEIRIRNTGIMSSLIGSFYIDLEDRILTEKKLRQRLTFQAYLEEAESKYDELRYKNEDCYKNPKQQLQLRINELNQKLEALDNDIKVPVEYKELRLDGNEISQGVVELFVEPFPLETAQNIPPSNLNRSKPKEFEIRLIIWETTAIPIPPGMKCVSIFVKVALDSSASGTDEEIIKETDCHNGSTTGNGEFNWRMVFPLVLPCGFPRLRFQVYNFSTMGSDQLGETVISLKKIIHTLKTDGRYKMQTTIFKFADAKFPGQDRGEVNISMDIIPKQEADSDKVGEGQNEPNHDPFLKKPTEGRGIADFFRGTGLDFNFWGVICQRILKIILAFAFSAIVTMILFVKPGILMK